jgi:hypothetical protein
MYIVGLGRYPVAFRAKLGDRVTAQVIKICSSIPIPTPHYDFLIGPITEFESQVGVYNN